MRRLEGAIPMEIIPEINMYKNKIFVIKYGGSIMGNAKAQKSFMKDVSLLKKAGIFIVLVHGGGPEISKCLKSFGIETKFINGLRVTDSSTMEIVEMVLSGSINKNISSKLSGQGVSAIGISGRDGNLIKAKKKYITNNSEKIDIGYVGEVAGVNKKLLMGLLKNDMLPVISPIGSDGRGNAYNINADYVAAAIASSLKADKLIMMTDTGGVYKDINDSSSLLSQITVNEIKEYINLGIISGGMIPKMECCMEAFSKGTKNIHLIDGRKEHSLLVDTFTNSGTKIIAKGGFNQCQKVI
jgi:acetylglutamate kinase